MKYRIILINKYLNALKKLQKMLKILLRNEFTENSPLRIQRYIKINWVVLLGTYSSQFTKPTKYLLQKEKKILIFKIWYKYNINLVYEIIKSIKSIKFLLKLTIWP
jgi:hypothetical protein